MKQTMVKDIKLREIVPKEKHICVNPDDSTSSWGKQRKRQGYNESINKVLSTDISNVEEYVELDIEQIEQAIREISLDNNALWEEMDKVDNLGVCILAEAIAQADVIKFRSN